MSFENRVNPASVGVLVGDNVSQKSEIASALKCDIEYSLRLANGQGWQVIFTNGLRPWATKMASIMELNTSKSNGFPKLIFVQKESNTGKYYEPIPRLDESMQHGLPRNGWEVREGNEFRLWSHRDVADVICEIRCEESQELGILMMQLSMYPIYQRAQDSGGLPLHAGLVKRDGRGIILAAPSNRKIYLLP